MMGDQRLKINPSCTNQIDRSLIYIRVAKNGNDISFFCHCRYEWIREIVFQGKTYHYDTATTLRKVNSKRSTFRRARGIKDNLSAPAGSQFAKLLLGRSVLRIQDSRCS